MTNTPVISTVGVVYAGLAFFQGDNPAFAADQRVLALNPDGSTRWQCNLQANPGGALYSPTLAEEGNIYCIGMPQATLYGISPTGGKLFELASESGVTYQSPLLSLDELLYYWNIFLSDYSTPLHVVGADGSVISSIAAPDGNSNSSMAVTQGGSIVACLLAASVSTLWMTTPDGSSQWQLDIPGSLGSSPCVALDGTIYCTSGNPGGLYSVYPNGTERWHTYVNVSGGGIPSPVAANNGKVYVGTYDGDLLAINSEGHTEWAFDTGSKLFFQTAMIDGAGTIYIGGDRGILYAINPDGTEKWEFASDTAGSTFGYGAAMGPDGTIYITCSDGALYAIGEAGS